MCRDLPYTGFSVVVVVVDFVVAVVIVVAVVLAVEVVEIHSSYEGLIGPLLKYQNR